VKAYCALAFVLLVVPLAGGCAGDERLEAAPTEEAAPVVKKVPSEEIRLTLDGQEGAQNVGVLMAQQLGYFTEAGLSVRVASPLLPRRPLPYVIDRVDELGIAQMPQVAIAKGKGAPVIAVGALISPPTERMIWLKGSNIRSIADLRGKTIAYPGVPFQMEFLRSVLAGAGLGLDDVEVRDVGYKLVPALVSGRADAIFGGSWNLEGVVLEIDGEEPVVRRLQAPEGPSYEESVVVARTDLVAKDPQLIRAFLSAVARGTAAATEEPEAGVNVIQEYGSSVSRETTKAQVEATLPLLSRSGSMSSDHARTLVEWMRDEDMIQRRFSVAALLTNAYH
jgi:ABC-type nitrate/sulfonate/bicarbonate transport system substrate-binding protein